MLSVLCKLTAFLVPLQAILTETIVVINLRLGSCFTIVLGGFSNALVDIDILFLSVRQ